MAICNKKCANIPPTAVSSCEKEIRTGGISHLVFARCNVEFSDIQDPVQWCKYVQKGDIVISTPIVGQKPKGNFTTKLRNSCAMEDTSGLEQTINFQAHDADIVNNLDFDFWQRIQSESDFMQFGWITCEGHFYGFVPKFSMELGYVIEETNLDSSFWDGSITWQSMEILKPQYIFNLTSYLQGDCDEVLNFNDCITCPFMDAEVAYRRSTPRVNSNVASFQVQYPPCPYISSQNNYVNEQYILVDYFPDAVYKLYSNSLIFDSSVVGTNLDIIYDPINGALLKIPFGRPLFVLNQFNTNQDPSSPSITDVREYLYLSHTLEITYKDCEPIYYGGLMKATPYPSNPSHISSRVLNYHNLQLDANNPDRRQVWIGFTNLYSNISLIPYLAYKYKSNPSPFNFPNTPSNYIFLSNIIPNQIITLAAKHPQNGCIHLFDFYVI